MNYLIITFVCLLAYSKTFFYGYVCDDLSVATLSGPAPKNKLKYFWQELICLHHWNSKLAHGISIVVHIIVCCLMYAIWHNLWASLLFACNPITSQCVAWASGRLYALSTIFAMIVYACPYFLVLYPIVAHFVSINIASLPLIFLFSKIWWVSILFPISVMLLWKKITRKVGKEPGVTKECITLAPRKLILYFKTFGYYTTLCLFAYRLGFNHQLLWGIGLNEKYDKKHYKIDRTFWIGIAWFLVAGYFILVKHSFAILWYLMLISQWCNILMLGTYTAERYAYLPALGLMLWLGQTLPPSFMPYILGGYMVRLWFYLPAYTSEYWQHHYSLSEFKEFGYVWLAEGLVDYRFGYVTKAGEYWLEGLKYNPDDFKLNFAITALYMRIGRIKDAEKHLKIAEQNYYMTEQLQLQKNTVATMWELIADAKKKGSVDLTKLPMIY